ncbi:unnamed protein product [Rhizophagus irregularis]|nr:unnamed protein product [Rhizophagus irregularis]
MLNLSSKESELTESELTELELTQYLEEGGMGVEPLLNLKLIKIYLFVPNFPDQFERHLQSESSKSYSWAVRHRRKCQTHGQDNWARVREIY